MGSCRGRFAAKKRSGNAVNSRFAVESMGTIYPIGSESYPDLNFNAAFAGVIYFRGVAAF